MRLPRQTCFRICCSCVYIWTEFILKQTPELFFFSFPSGGGDDSTCSWNIFSWVLWQNKLAVTSMAEASAVNPSFPSIRRTCWQTLKQAAWVYFLVETQFLPRRATNEKSIKACMVCIMMAGAIFRLGGVLNPDSGRSQEDWTNVTGMNCTRLKSCRAASADSYNLTAAALIKPSCLNSQSRHTYYSKINIYIYIYMQCVCVYIYGYFNHLVHPYQRNGLKLIL